MSKARQNITYTQDREMTNGLTFCLMWAILCYEDKEGYDEIAELLNQVEMKQLGNINCHLGTELE